jgi:hypothetical protein
VTEDAPTDGQQGDGADGGDGGVGDDARVGEATEVEATVSNADEAPHESEIAHQSVV